MTHNSKNDIWSTIEQIVQYMPDVQMNTFWQWKFRGYTPPCKHYEIIVISKKLKLGITHETLHEQWLKNAPAGKNRKKTRYI